MARLTPMAPQDPQLANAALAAVIRGRRATVKITRQSLSDASGLPVDTIKNIESGTQKISMDQILRLAGPLGRTPDALVRDAVEELESMNAEAVSEAPVTNVTSIHSAKPRHPRDMTVEELENLKEPSAAQSRDPESDAPEED